LLTQVIGFTSITTAFKLASVKPWKQATQPFVKGITQSTNEVHGQQFLHQSTVIAILPAATRKTTTALLCISA
jgi:hypothetical protein